MLAFLKIFFCHVIGPTQLYFLSVLSIISLSEDWQIMVFACPWQNLPVIKDVIICDWHWLCVKYVIKQWCWATKWQSLVAYSLKAGLQIMRFIRNVRLDFPKKNIFCQSQDLHYFLSLLLIISLSCIFKVNNIAKYPASPRTDKSWFLPVLDKICLSGPGPVFTNILILRIVLFLEFS